MSTTTNITHPDGTTVSVTTTAGGGGAGGTLAKYYTMTGAANPVIVDLAAGELGVDLSSVYREVDLMGMENRNPVSGA